ncbi:MAG: di-trans,poly-cis-decaprenylcistransferase [Pseudomonadota bacterium]
MQTSFEGHNAVERRPHVAIIMDGNGRWATGRGLPRAAGHAAGVSAVREVVEAAPRFGVGTLTLFAFSADNWKRPVAEVDALFGLLRTYMAREVGRLADAGIRLTAIGRRDRLPDDVVAAVRHAEAVTRSGDKLHLRIAIDYSARHAILQAAVNTDGGLTEDAISAALAGPNELPRDVDLLIRCGGEHRLSDFMLWEAAYAELYFTDVAWPDFGATQLAAALAAYGRRERRFGGLPDNATRRTPAAAIG